MPQTADNPATIGSQLAEPLRVGEPDVAGSLVVFPLFGPAPGSHYLTFPQAFERGVRIRELEQGASVNDVVIDNPTDDEVLLFDGEEILGAQQNRTLDVSVLLAAHSKLRVPVSCVEAGRWDGSRHLEAFEPSPQAAHPRMRRMKSSQARKRALVGAETRADQSAVWAEADQLAMRHGADAPTGATHDVYESRRGRLNEICGSLPCHEGQVGAIAAYGGELQVLDYVSRPEAYASLHQRLVQGYALDALDATDMAAPEIATARGFALLAADAPIAHRAPSVGRGDDLRFAANGVAGSALTLNDELIQLTAFPGDDLQWDRERILPGSSRGRPIRPPSRHRG